MFVKSAGRAFVTAPSHNAVFSMTPESEGIQKESTIFVL